MRFSAIIIFFFLSVFSVHGQDCFPQPNDRQLVYDVSDVLTAQEEQVLNQRLIKTSNETSNQIVIVVVDQLCGMDKAQYANELGHEWGVGREGEDNGIVILVKPTKIDGPRTTFIAVGYGLEGVIPDATAKLIVENEMNPRFKEGQFYQGFTAALDVIIPLAKEEFDYVAYQEKAGGKKGIPWFFLVLVILFIVIGSRRGGGSFWTAFLLGNLLGGGGRRGGPWDDFSSGGGSFGGFGGGGFGGGGAGGDW